MFVTIWKSDKKGHDSLSRSVNSNPVSGSSIPLHTRLEYKQTEYFIGKTAVEK